MTDQQLRPHQEEKQPPIHLVARSWNQIAYVVGEGEQRVLTLSTPEDAQKVWNVFSSPPSSAQKEISHD